MTTAFDADRFQAAGARFTAFFNELGRAFVEREDVLAQVALALLGREHVLMTGPPGTAKSQIASAVLRRIVDESSGAPSLFARQFTESTVQTDLIGPINFKTLMDTGRTEHFTDEGMLGAVHAFLDEVFDGRDMLLRSALNVLHERELKQGTKTTRGSIECAIMTTNRYLAEILEGSRDTLLAFVDRIAFLNFVPKGFADPKNLATVLRRQVAGYAPPLESQLTIQDLDALQSAADAVHVSEEVCDALVNLLSMLDVETAQAARADPQFVATRYLSTRTAVRACRLLRAICVYDKLFRASDRPLEVSTGDFLGLRLHLLLAGPSPQAIEAILARETDPRERRQLTIVRTEREIFERCLAKLPPVTASPPRPPVDIPHLRRVAAKALPSTNADDIANAARELSAAAAGGQKGADEAARMLRETVTALTQRALRTGITVGAAPDRSIDAVVADLSQLADGLDKTAGSGRAIARWLRGRALLLVEDAAALAPASSAGSLEALLGGSVTVEGVAKHADDRMARLEKLGALRGKLLAQSAEVNDEARSERAWRTGVGRLEDELAVVWDVAFCKAVAEALARVPANELTKVLAHLAPVFQQIDAFGARLHALSGEPSRLKARVVGPRIAPLVKAVFERLDARDRLALVQQIDGLLADLARAGLAGVVPPDELLAWCAAALARGEKRDVASQVPLAPSLAGFRALRNAEQRVPVAYTLVEIALRVAPDITAEATQPVEATAAVLGLFAGLPERLRTDLPQFDLARVARAVTYLEAWWQSMAGPLAQPVGPFAPADATKRLEAILTSEFFRVTRNESTLARFALEARVVAEVFPAFAEAARELRERIERLEVTSTAYFNGLVWSRSEGAWAQVLGASRVGET